MLVAALGSQAADDPARTAQQRVKAAFLYKFAGYVEWPAEAFPDTANPIVIGVAGADDVAAELDQAVVGRQVAGRPLQVRRLPRDDSAGTCCHIVFVGAGGDPGRARELLAQARERPVLTVTDSPRGHPAGSVINFVAAGDRIRFDIARDTAERNGLQLRSQLLAVAREVIGQ